MSLGLQNVDEVANKAGRVGVLMGGCSAEREISLKSGEMIFNALTKAGIEAVKLMWNDDLGETLAGNTYDRVFIALHGRGGEDGQVQGLLGLQGIPYTGSGVLGSALAMDKVRSKQVWRANGLPTPQFVFISPDIDFDLTSVNVYPVMVKPAREGSSIGISKVHNKQELEQAIEKALTFDDLILVENFVSGAEYTLSILKGQTLPLIRLETPNEFYDYEAKYLSDNTQYHCPAGLSTELEEQCAELGLRAFLALGASGWGRVDFMLNSNSEPLLIEVNTVPGMTDHSLVPMAAAAAGIDFEQLALHILSTSFGGSKG